MTFHFIDDSDVSINKDIKKTTGDNIQTERMESENGKMFEIHI